jgi:hypothetical protein
MFVGKDRSLFRCFTRVRKACLLFWLFARVFVPGRPIHPSLMFASKARILFRCFTREGLVLLANIRLGWKGLPGTNNLAYYKYSKITPVKSFITLGLGVNVIKLFHICLCCSGLISQNFHPRGSLVMLAGKPTLDRGKLRDGPSDKALT